MSDTPISRKPATTREEMQERLDELREKGGTRKRIDEINRQEDAKKAP